MSMTTESMSVVPMLVGQYRKGEALEFLPFSLIEIERAKHAALRILQGFHFRTGRTVLITSLCNEPTQFLPIERAVQSYGLVTTMADAFTFDAGRVESTIRRFDTAAVIGVNAEVVEGLEMMGHDPVKVLSKADAVWARPDAFGRLEQDLPNLYSFLELGPAVAMECGRKRGAHIDRFEWQVDVVDGEIVLTSMNRRAESFSKFRTGVKGRVEFDVCDCGNIDPRIILE